MGLIVADISNPFSSAIARIVEDEADKHNYTVIFGSSDENPQKSWKLIDTLLNKQVDGFIIAPAEGTESQILYLEEQGIPFALVDRYFPNLNANYVAMDNYKAAYTAIIHLMDCGYERIGLITYRSSLFHLQERKRGYITALQKNKIVFKKSWLREVDMNNTRAAVEKAVDELLRIEQPVDALLFVSNTIASYGLKYIKSLNIRVPDDLALLSFDETESLDLFYAPLTYIKQPLREMGQLATKILLDNIERNNKKTHINMEAELVVRASTTRKKIDEEVE